MGSQRKKNTHIAQPTCRMARREMVINLLDSVFVGANQTRCGVCVCVCARAKGLFPRVSPGASTNMFISWNIAHPVDRKAR